MKRTIASAREEMCKEIREVCCLVDAVKYFKRMKEDCGSYIVNHIYSLYIYIYKRSLYLFLSNRKNISFLLKYLQ